MVEYMERNQMDTGDVTKVLTLHPNYIHIITFQSNFLIGILDLRAILKEVRRNLNESEVWLDRLCNLKNSSTFIIYLGFKEALII